jgi:hypothetical protein
VGADLCSSRRACAVGLAAAVLVASLAGGVVGLGAQAPSTSPFGGRLAKALFLTDTVADDLAASAAAAPADLKPAIAAAVERARQPQPPVPAGAAPMAGGKERREALVQSMVALAAAPEARAESAAASVELLAPMASPVHTAQGAEIPLWHAELAERYMKAHAGSPLAPFLYTYAMVQYRLAFERQTAAKALEGQKASAKKYRAFLLRARASADPLVKAAAADIDAQPFLQRATEPHPRDFDPDACCRDK